MNFTNLIIPERGVRYNENIFKDGEVAGFCEYVIFLVFMYSWAPIVRKSLTYECDESYCSVIVLVLLNELVEWNFKL